MFKGTGNGLVAGVIVLSLSLLLSSCITVGRHFAGELVSHIKVGETTRQDIERLFGSPWRTGVEDGDNTWTYGHYRYSAFGKTMTNDLVIRFDDTGVVKSFTYNTTAPQ